MDNQQVEAFLRHYRGQYGLGFPVYRGERFQSGNGLGNILSGIGRFLLPILVPSAQAFISATAQQMNKGLGIKDAAKAALTPTWQTAALKTMEQVNKRLTGKGRRRRRRNTKAKSKAKSKSRVVKRKRTVYKATTGGGRKRKSPVKKRRIRKRVRVLSPNFANF